MSGIPEDAVNNKRWVTFFLCAGLIGLSFFYRASNAIIAVELSHDLNLSVQDLGLLSAIFFYINIFTQMPFGLWIDRFGPWRCMVFINLAGIAGVLIFSQAGCLATGLVGRGILGGCMAVNLAGSLILLSNLFKPHEYATISGLLLSLGSLGFILAASPLRLLVDTIGWRFSFMFFAFIQLALVAGVWVCAGDEMYHRSDLEAPSDPSGKMLGVLHGLRTLLTNRFFWSLGISIGLYYGAFGAIHMLWGGPFLIIHLQQTPMFAGQLLLLLSIGLIIGSPISGILSDRVLKSRQKTLIIGLSGAATCLLIMAGWPGSQHVSFLVIIFFLFGFFCGFGTIYYVHLKEFMPASISGIAMGGVNVFTAIGAAFFLHALGKIVGRGSGGRIEAGGDYFLAINICFIAMVLAIVTYSLNGDTIKKREARY